jgi:hypothetical protein
VRPGWWQPLIVAVLAVSWAAQLFAEGWVWGVLALGCAAGGVVAGLTMRAASRLVWWWPLLLTILAVAWSGPLFAAGWMLGVAVLACAAGGVIAALVMRATVRHTDRAASG